MAEQALVGGNAHPGAFNLALTRLAAQLPRQLTDLCQRLSGHSLAKACQTARGVNRQTAAEFGIAIAHQLCSLTARAQLQVFIPVHFQC